MNIRTALATTLLVTSTGFATAAAAASITIHKQPRFAGAQVTLHDALPNLTTIGFQNQASSLVLNGTWELCSQPNYGGDCVVLAPGRYETLDARLNHRVESARPLAEGDATGRSQRGSQVTLYKGQKFTGPTLSLSDASANLAHQGFQNQASSAVVTGGRWEFCSSPEGRGDCVVLNPGRYERLDQKVYHRMESARPVGEAWPSKERQRTALAQREERPEARQDRREERREGRRADRGAIDLYPGPDFRGRPLRLEQDVESLGGSRMDERVSSLIVHDGVWQACTRPGFEGRCRTFEPGEYPSIDRMDDRIASLRLMR